MIKCVFSNNVGWILTEKNYAEDWMNLSYEEKRDAVILAFRNNIKILNSEEVLNAWVEKFEKANFFELFIEVINDQYAETGENNHYDVMCQDLVADLLSRLKEQAIKKLEEEKLND